MVLPPAVLSPRSFEDEQARDVFLSQGPAYYFESASARTIPSFEVDILRQANCVTLGRLDTATCLQLLPEANLRHVLSLLPLSERIRSAELVSKQWRTALRDQEALSVLDFSADPAWNRQVWLSLQSTHDAHAMVCQQ